MGNGTSMTVPVNSKVNLSDFAFFLAVMANKDAYESVLSIITGERDLELKDVKVEQVILNERGKRAIRLDAWAVDSKNRQFNTEMQNDTEQDDIRKRSRFYQSMIDTPILKAGKATKYRQLPPTVITFITQEDIFKEDLAEYEFTEQCETVNGLYLEDGTKKIFLNMTSKNGRPELVSLLQYMKHTDINNPDIVMKDERILKLNSIVNEVRQSEEWEDVNMSIYSMGIAAGYAQAVVMLLKTMGSISKEIEKRILSETNMSVLQSWMVMAANVDNVTEFEERLQKQEE